MCSPVESVVVLAHRRAHRQPPGPPPAAKAFLRRSAVSPTGQAPGVVRSTCRRCRGTPQPPRGHAGRDARTSGHCAGFLVAMSRMDYRPTSTTSGRRHASSSVQETLTPPRRARELNDGIRAARLDVLPTTATCCRSRHPRCSSHHRGPRAADGHSVLLRTSSKSRLPPRHTLSTETHAEGVPQDARSAFVLTGCPHGDLRLAPPSKETAMSAKSSTRASASSRLSWIAVSIRLSSSEMMRKRDARCWSNRLYRPD